MKRLFLIFILLFTTVSLWAKGGHDTSLEETRRPRVFAANYPLYYLCQRIAGEEIDLIWPFRSDEDPAFWEPDEDQIRELQGADLLVLNGAGYEKWLEYSFIDPNQITDSSSRFKNEFIDDAGGTSHSHGAGAVHDHGGTAFSLWMDLDLYARQADSVFESLVRLLPEQKDLLEKRQGELLQDLRVLDQSFKTTGDALKTETILASHPVYQYFSRAYTGEIQALLLEPDLFPSQEDRGTLETLQKQFNSSVMIWEGEPLEETQEMLEEMNIRWVVISPGFNKPVEGDYLDILNNNLKELQRLRDFNS